MPSTFSGLPGPNQLLQFQQGVGDKMTWFWYTTVQQTILPAGPAAATQIVVDATSDFLALTLVGHSDQDDLFETSPAAVAGNFYTIQISSSSSDRAYQSNPLHSRCVVGNANLPQYLSTPILFPHASAINITLTPLNPAVTYNIFIAFGGVKIYRYAQNR